MNDYRYSNIPDKRQSHHGENHGEWSTLLKNKKNKKKEDTAGAAAGNNKNGRIVVGLHRTSLGQWHKWIPFFYLHRILRILPSYMFSVLFWWKASNMCTPS